MLEIPALQFLRDINIWSILLRLFLSVLCAGLIGLERGAKRQPAGFRTHILVCTGGCMAMMTGQYVFQYLSASADPSRLGAQVISGIGFLGMGTIIVTGSNRVKGLTTAAGLWASACIGLTLGIGFYEAAVGGTIIVLLAITVMRKVDEYFYAKVPVCDIYMELENITAVHSLMESIRQNGMKVTFMEMQKPKSHLPGAIGLLLTVQKLSRKDKMDMIATIGSFDKVIFIEELL